MEKKIRIQKQILAEDTQLDVGAVFHLEKTSSPIIRLFRERFLEDHDCIKGDIEFLFEFDGSGIDDE